MQNRDHYKLKYAYKNIVALKYSISREEMAPGYLPTQGVSRAARRNYFVNAVI